MLVSTLFMGVVGALPLALVLAFGLGGKDTAGELVKEWRTKAQEAAPKAKEAAQNAKASAEKSTSTTPPPSKSSGT